MQRTISALLSTITVFFLFAATAASAASPITAQLAEAPSDRVQIIRSTAWVCEGDICRTNNAGSRDSYECLRMARELGTVVSFAVSGEAFTAEQLAECNENAG